MEFLVASTWLALTIWASEHGALVAAVVLAGITPRRTAPRRSVGA